MDNRINELQKNLNEIMESKNKKELLKFSKELDQLIDQYYQDTKVKKDRKNKSNIDF